MDDVYRDESGRYAKKYECDQETEIVTGCPARAPNVAKIMKSIKTKGWVKGVSAARQHAEAMMVEELTYVMEWSEAQCPGQWLSMSKWNVSQFHDTRLLFSVV